MKIKVQVKTNCSEQKIEDFGEHNYLVYLKSAPENNKANVELLKLLGKHLGIPSTKLQIVAGNGSRNKVIEILS